MLPAAVADPEQQTATRSLAQAGRRDARQVLARHHGRGDDVDLLAGDPRAFGKAVRQSAVLGEETDRPLIDGPTRGSHVVLLGAEVDEVRLGYRTGAIHR